MEPALERLRVILTGAVQGVGFRPFVFRLAHELNLRGWVENNASGVALEVEGYSDAIAHFLPRLASEKPPHAFIQSLEPVWLDPYGYDHFEIRESKGGPKTAMILPDIATCPDCLSEILDPKNRRYRYPFTNCTHCGPRFSIIRALPYDRSNTTMQSFVQCPACQKEYENPGNRRFHAQPNACPVCGPKLALWDRDGKVLSAENTALMETAEALRKGKIVALKGLGGFQILADARNSETLNFLRERKHRGTKPFALMFPGLASVREYCDVSNLEGRLLTSSEAPIVLLKRKLAPASGISESAAPGNPTLGCLLPYTPLHHLLMNELGFPVVATSGNLSEEPICIGNEEALERLHEIADLFLVHDRPIARQVDDSVARVMLDRELVLRRARGYAPLPVHMPKPLTPVLAVGAHLKNTIAIASGQNVFISQHIGDLETPQAYAAFEKVIADLSQLYDFKPRMIACDAHPDYLSTQHAKGGSLPVQEVQHHFAHLRACMAENELSPPALGIVWDGTGHGPDGTIWGGEFLLAMRNSFQRMGTFRPFRLPGGSVAIREPRRCAMGLLYEVLGESAFNRRVTASAQAFSDDEIKLIASMIKKGINSPWTSSVGRLFDGIASLIGLRHHLQYEGQAGMEMEFAAEMNPTKGAYPLRLIQASANAASSESSTDNPLPQPSLIQVDWTPMVYAVLEDVRRQAPPGIMAARFHNFLIEAMVGVARFIGEDRVVLTGGCFQNRLLCELAVSRLIQEGFRPYWHQRIPPNDGGIALGQAVVAGFQP